MWNIMNKYMKVDAEIGLNKHSLSPFQTCIFLFHSNRAFFFILCFFIPLLLFFILFLIGLCCSGCFYIFTFLTKYPE